MTDNDTLQPVRLSFSTKLFYGLASLGTSTISGIYASLLPIFYQDYLGLSARWIGIASIIYAVWNAINDPLFGHVTDHTRSRLGRRIPYMRFTAPFLALTFILVWYAPTKGADFSKFLWMLVTMLLYDTCYTIIGLVHGALMPEITESDMERTKLSIYQILFGLIGTLLGFVIPDFFRPKAGAASSSLMSLQLSMIAVGMICAFLIILATYKIKERREFSLVDEPLGLWTSLKYTLSSRSFIIFVIMNFMGTLMMAMSTGALFYVSDYVTQSSAMPLLAAIFIPLAAGVPLTQLMLKKMEPVRAMQIYSVIAGVGLVSAGFMPAHLIFLSMAIAGVGLSGTQTLTYILLAEVIDEDEVRTGVRREGSFLGTNALITKPAQSIALALMPLVLEATGFVTREANANQIFLNQSAEALFGIRTIVGVIPGAALLLGALVLTWYPLRGKYLAEIKEKMLTMHSEKKSRLDAMLES